MKKLDKQQKADLAALGLSMAAGAGIAAAGTQLATDALSEEEPVTPVEPVKDEEEEIIEVTPEVSPLEDDPEPPYTAPSEPTHEYHAPAEPEVHVDPVTPVTPVAEDDEIIEVRPEPETTPEVETEEPVIEVNIETEESRDDSNNTTGPVDDKDDIEVEQEIEITVIGFETVTLDDGTLCDFAYIEQGGRQGAIVDIDRDGRADFMMFDVNANGDIDEAEIFDVREDNWDMTMFYDEDIVVDPAEPEVAEDIFDDPNPDMYYALDDESSDYINDADVNDFLEA